MKTLWQIIKDLRSELLAVAAMLIQRFLGIAPQIPLWMTGMLVFVGSRVGILTKTAAAEIEWLNRRVFLLEFRMFFFEQKRISPRDIHSRSNGICPPIRGYGLPVVR